MDLNPLANLDNAQPNELSDEPVIVLNSPSEERRYFIAVS